MLIVAQNRHLNKFLHRSAKSVLNKIVQQITNCIAKSVIKYIRSANLSSAKSVLKFNLTIRIDFFSIGTYYFPQISYQLCIPHICSNSSNSSSSSGAVVSIIALIFVPNKQHNNESNPAAKRPKILRTRLTIKYRLCVKGGVTLGFWMRKVDT